MLISNLTLGTPYHVRVTPYNSGGAGNLSTALVIPNQAPLIPENVSVEILSGQRVRMSFCNPLVHADDIWAFHIQWDSDITFSNANDSSLASCSSVGFGSCIYSVSAIDGECPFYYTVENLSPGVQYHFRISALGNIEAPVIRGIDTTNWSGTLSLTPENQPPGPPESAMAYSFSGDCVQVHVSMPTEDGGLPVESLTFEVDMTPYFTSDSLIEEVVPATSLPSLHQGGPVVHTIEGLSTGEAYYVRVKATSSIGTGISVDATGTPIVPMEAAGPVNDLMVTYDSSPSPNQLTTTVGISWLPPSNQGGNNITSYLIEWWETESFIEEIQIIQLSWLAGDAPPPSADDFTLAFKGYGGATQITATSPAVTVRDALMNIYDGVSSFPTGHVEVNRSTINGNEGFSYSVKFIDTPGNQPPIVALDTFSGSGTVDVLEQTPGICAGGAAEVQVISTSGTGGGDRSDANVDNQIIRGFWRVQFSSSKFSAYLSAGASASEVQTAISGLSTTGEITVSRYENAKNGFDWAVRFTTPVGDRGVMVSDNGFLWSENGDAALEIHDGDNAVDPTDGTSLCAMCAIGEKAVGYDSAIIDGGAALLSHSIDTLQPGLLYSVRVSAINDNGMGIGVVGSTSIPVVAPSSPSNVTATTYGGINGDGDPQRINVSYSEPDNSGGAPITAYLVELDPTPTFDAPIGELFQCSNHLDYSTWEIETPSGTTDGFFYLTLTRGSLSATTDPVPFDAPALAIDEIPATPTVNSFVTCVSDPITCPDARLESSGSMQMKLNLLDGLLQDGVLVSRHNISGAYRWTITFLDSGDDFDLVEANQGSLVPDVPITATKVSSGNAHGACSGDMIIPTTGGLVKGQNYYTRVMAYNRIGYSQAMVAPVPARPITVPGRPTTVTLDVYDATTLQVTFSPPTDSGGDPVSSYLVEWSTTSTFDSMSTFSATVSMLSGGAPFHKVITGLVMGTPVYIRVYAVNSLGPGEAQVSSPTFLHPYMEPGAPTNVELSVTSDTMLTVSMSPPDLTGGDDITGYVVMWDISEAFNSLSGTPNKGNALVDASWSSYTIEYLSTTRQYWVQVAAQNSAGNGLARISTPSSASPLRQQPGKPVGVILADGMSAGEVVVSWDAPVIPWHGKPCGGTLSSPTQCSIPIGGTAPGSNGGDNIVSYNVQWSVSQTFSLSVNSINVPAEDPRSIVIATGRTAGEIIYVRVAALNTVGFGAYCIEGGDTCSDGTQLLWIVT